MSIIAAKFCEIEVQEQTLSTEDNAGVKYMVVLSYEPEKTNSKEIISIVLTNNKPIIKQTIAFNDAVVNKNIPTTEKPKPITTPEGLFGE
tara:strand:- start:180 stop:449 length:270 start_codon:yes stop_codon:yes gene_type:complete